MVEIMKTSIITVDSSTGYYDIYAPIYDWNGYIINAEGECSNRGLIHSVRK